MHRHKKESCSGKIRELSRRLELLQEWEEEWSQAGLVRDKIGKVCKS